MIKKCITDDRTSATQAEPQAKENTGRIINTANSTFPPTSCLLQIVKQRLVLTLMSFPKHRLYVWHLITDSYQCWQDQGAHEGKKWWRCFLHHFSLLCLEGIELINPVVIIQEHFVFENPNSVLSLSPRLNRLSTNSPLPPPQTGERSKLHGTKVHGARARAFDVFCSQMSWWPALML